MIKVVIATTVRVTKAGFRYIGIHIRTISLTALASLIRYMATNSRVVPPNPDMPKDKQEPRITILEETLLYFERRMSVIIMNLVAEFLGKEKIPHERDRWNPQFLKEAAEGGPVQP